MEINGTIAGDTGIYPKIKVQNQWKICNWNVDSNFVKFLNGKKESYFRFWNNRRKAENSLFSETFDGSTTPLAPYNSEGNCVSLTEDAVIDTSISNWYTSAQFEGHPSPDGQQRADGNPYCYAYAFNPIQIKYGDCDMSVSRY
jgi:hypothetical protein